MRIIQQYVDTSTVSELPDDLRPFAQQIIERRAAFKAAPKSFGYDRYVQGTSHFAARMNFNPTCRQICVPAAEDLDCHSNLEWRANRRWFASPETDWATINKKCNTLAIEILKIRPALYGRWIVGNLRMAVERLTRRMASSKSSILTNVHSRDLTIQRQSPGTPSSPNCRSQNPTQVISSRILCCEPQLDLRSSSQRSSF